MTKSKTFSKIGENCGVRNTVPMWEINEHKRHFVPFSGAKSKGIGLYMTKIAANFVFHPIGQGLFYSGDVGGFNFVYDCGTESKKQFLSREIQNYKRQVSSLDMLVISHFHKDHISGLPELTERLNPKRILIPYVTTEEMLLSFVYAKSDPASISVLKYFAGHMYGDGVNNNTLLPESKVTVIKHSEQQMEENTASISTLPDRIADATVVQALNKEYEFKFFNSDSFTPATIAGFYAEIEAKYGKHWRTDLVEIVEANLDDIAIIYRKNFGLKKLNLTTLVCCHGPKSGAVSNSLAQGTSQYIWGHGTKLSSPSVTRQLLTGDINFQVSLVAMQKHYRREWPEIFLSLIPHHGSRDGWNSGSLSSLCNCIFWPCTFGVGNRHHHPHFETVSPFLTRREHFLQCTQDPPSEISIHMTI